MTLFTGHQLLIASRNHNKIKEISALLKPLRLELLTAFDIDIPTPEETGKSFLENALIKAQAYCRAANMPALADDSGLSIEALDGFPGVDTAPFAEQHGGYLAAAQVLQQKLQGKSTRAFFTSCIVLMMPGGQFDYAQHHTYGHLKFPPQGDAGWGFNFIFVPDGYQQTYAELTPEEKTSIDHRSYVIRQIMAKCFKAPAI